LKRPARRRVEWFTECRRGLIARYGLEDQQALADAYDLALLFVEWRMAAYELGQTRRRQEEGEEPSPTVQTRLRRLGLARRDYNIARRTFEERWAGKVPGHGDPLADVRRAVAEVNRP
jgi:hypothetical protein